MISIDQGEELFRAEGHDQAQRLLTLLRDLLDEDEPALIVVIAIRSDSYAQLQEVKALEGLRKVPFDLGPMPHGSYAEVIKGPATRLEETTRRLKIDDGLVGVLLRDIEVGGAKDALPLLSFTMERLYLENGGTGRLTVTDYRNLGGIQRLDRRSGRAGTHGRHGPAGSERSCRSAGAAAARDDPVAGRHRPRYRCAAAACRACFGDPRRQLAASAEPGATAPADNRCVGPDWRDNGRAGP